MSASASPVRIATLLGDGIGPDVVTATMRVLEKAGRAEGVTIEFDVLPAGLSALETHGSTLPEETQRLLLSYTGWMLGPISQHLYPRDDVRYINPSGFLRTKHNLYANIRPVRSFAGVPSMRGDIDLVIVRENTEGFYADRNVLDGNGELRPNEDLVISVRVVSREACTRLAHQAFRLARQRDAGRTVTAVHKANVLRRGDGLFLECCRAVAEEYPDVTLNDYHVDACALFLITRGNEFDVIATTNMYGDILSDEAAGLVGGLGLAPSVNAGDRHAMAQAVHGSAPDIAHLHVADPVAEILSGKMLLDWLAEREANAALARVAWRVEDAVSTVLAEGTRTTPDLGGTCTTEEMTEAILERV